jgi:hypothetical protein
MFFSDKRTYFAWKHPNIARRCSTSLQRICCPCICLAQCLFGCLAFFILPLKAWDAPSNREGPEEDKQRCCWTIECKRRQRRFKKRTSLSAGTTSSGYNQQASSSFFSRLPIEIRRQIYGYVLNDEPFLHLTIAPWKRITIVDCAQMKTHMTVHQLDPEDDSDLALLKHTGCIWANDHSWTESKRPTRHNKMNKLPTLSLQILSLLMSCRKM